MEQKNGECNIYKTFKKSDRCFQANVIFPRNTLRAICEASSALLHMRVGQRLIDKHLVFASIFGSQDYKWIYDSSIAVLSKNFKKNTPAPDKLMVKKARQHVGQFGRNHICKALFKQLKRILGCERDPSTPQDECIMMQTRSNPKVKKTPWIETISTST